jgi:hypothetical protein
VLALLPESRNPAASRLDLRGVLVSAAGMAGITYGVIEAGGRHPAPAAAAPARGERQA